MFSRLVLLKQIMMLKKLLSLWLPLILVSVSIADEEIKPDQKVTGKIAAAALKSVSPKDGIITDTIAWRKLWAAWCPTKPIPNVEFQKQIVLVETVDGPNNMFVNQLMLNEKLELRYDVASTRIDGPGFAYLIMVVPKTGIRKINGKPVPLPTALPSIHSPKASSVAESVQVEITGRVRTGVVSIGAETTGAMIAADGIVMELDFQNDEQLLEAARHLGTSMARVKGRLKPVAGVEVSKRWIVKVDSLAPIDNQPKNRTNQADARPRVTYSRPNDSRPANPQPDNPLPAKSRPANQPELETRVVEKSFESIKVETTGGLIGVKQQQTVDAKGNVILEINGQRADNWELGAATMSRLHQFVTNTDWRSVPRNTRTANVADVFNYTITVETPKGMTRIFIDSPAVAKQPVIKQLLTYLRKPKSPPRRNQP